MKPAQSYPACFEIRVEGHLPPHWKDWFDGLTISLNDDGDTYITGNVVDQSALHGLIKKIRDLGLPLVSVNRVQSDETQIKKGRKEEK